MSSDFVWGTPEVRMEVEGLDRLLRDAYEAGVDAGDLSRATGVYSKKMVDLAKAKARASFVTPKRTGQLIRAIKPKRSRISVTIRTDPRCVYLARQHWGIDGVSGPWWADKARNELAEEIITGLTNEVYRLMGKHDLKPQ